MRLNRQQVIERLKAGEELSDDGVMAKFKDGGQCNVFTFWWLRDRDLIIYRPAGHSKHPCYWYWNKDAELIEYRRL